MPLLPCGPFVRAILSPERVQAIVAWNKAHPVASAKIQAKIAAAVKAAVVGGAIACGGDAAPPPAPPAVAHAAAIPRPPVPPADLLYSSDLVSGALQSLGDALPGLFGIPGYAGGEVSGYDAPFAYGGPSVLFVPAALPRLAMRESGEQVALAPLGWVEVGRPISPQMPGVSELPPSLAPGLTDLPPSGDVPGGDIPAAVVEPSTLALLGGWLIAVGIYANRRR